MGTHIYIYTHICIYRSRLFYDTHTHTLTYTHTHIYFAELYINTFNMLRIRNMVIAVAVVRIVVAAAVSS